MPSPRELAEQYFTAWQGQDAAALADVLAEDVTFRGPLGEADGRDACIRGLLGMRASIVTDIQVKARLADDQDVITWFDLCTEVAPPTPTANWSHVEHERITRIRVSFDPRGVLGTGGDHA